MPTGLKRRLAALETELGQTKEKAAQGIKSRDSTISARDVEIEELKKLVASLERELSDAKEQARKNAGAAANLEAELARLRTKVAQLEKALVDLQDKLDKSEQDKEKALKKIQAFDKQVVSGPRGVGR